jgi:aminoglycoside phosphotransferase (APT) family kinase protein
MDRLLDWLPGGVPAEGPAAIVHGDYRLDNLILRQDGPEVAAVLDWELSTLGDPRADFSYFLMQWIMPAEQRGGLLGADLQALGIPAVEEAVGLYEGLTGRTVGALDWLFSYNLFRLAAICQGIGGRVRDGTAASPEAAAMAARVEPLSEAAWNYARRAGA